MLSNCRHGIIYPLTLILSAFFTHTDALLSSEISVLDSGRSLAGHVTA